MKRYWVKLTLEVRNYDETTQKITDPTIKFEPATNLTPQPAEFIKGRLAEQAASLAKAFEDNQDGEGRHK